MKKFFAGMLVLLFALIVIRPDAAAAAPNTQVNSSTGKVEVFVPEKDKGYFKLEVKKGNQVRHYDLFNGENHFNLIYGNGNYILTTYQSSDGKRYKRVSSRQLTVKLKHSTAPYLHSTQNVTIDNATAQLAKSLSRSSYSTSQQTLTTSRHISRSIAYDHKKIAKLSSAYLPDNTDTLKMKRGICYDFASLNAGLLRSQGIPTRLVMGYAKGVGGYHAWNEVYVGGKWMVVDVTRDVTEKKVTNFRNASDYRASLYY